MNEEAEHELQTIAPTVVDTDKFNEIIMTTMAIHLSAQEAVEVLKRQGHDLTVSQYKRIVTVVRKRSKDDLAKFISDKVSHHLERMHMLLFMQRDLVRLYINTPDDQLTHKMKLSDRIVNLQPLLSQYQELSPFILPSKSDKPQLELTDDVLKI